jgi:hypothetical protein
MQKTNQIEKKSPVIPVIAIMAGGLAVMLVLLLAPWNFVPVQVTEDITVLAITEHGCVGESQYGVSVVVSECNAKVGDVISASFNVPAMEVNGFYDKVHERIALIEP